MTYFLAFGYGGMLFDATQDFWTSKPPTFRFPGLAYESYGRPMIAIVPVLISVLLVQPLFRMFRLSLDEFDRPPSNLPISILDLLSWTMLAAFICVWIRFLSSASAPVTVFSHLTFTQNFNEQIIHLLVSLVPATVLTAQLFAWRQHWLLAVLVLFAGWAADSLVTGFATHLIRTVTGTSLGVLSEVAFDRWCYTAGRSLLGFTFGGFALLFGIAIQRRPQEMTEPSDAPTPPNGAF